MRSKGLTDHAGGLALGITLNAWHEFPEIWLRFEEQFAGGNEH